MAITNIVVTKAGKGGGYPVARFTSNGAIFLNSANAQLGCNVAGETVQELHIVRATASVSNGVAWRVQRGANTVLMLSGGNDDIDLSDGMHVDGVGGEGQANVVVSKIGFGPSMLVLKFHKRAKVTSLGVDGLNQGSSY